MSSSVPESVTVAVTIDTEEDDWGSYHQHDPSTKNIAHLDELQDIFDRWGVRPTYLVNHPPLVNRKAVGVLGSLASRESVEIGAHCHPWNTPPIFADRPTSSMMHQLSREENRSKLREIRRRLLVELGIEPNSFRAGRWALGPTVAEPLVELGFEIDCSVIPFMDWSTVGGPDYSNAPHRPYRFDPAHPLRPAAAGRLIELPATVAFLAGRNRPQARIRSWLERGLIRHTKIVGVLDRMGILERRELSPETSSSESMIRLSDAWVSSGESFLQMTFHSCSLLPGSTPFVRTDQERARLLLSVENFLRYCQTSGFRFRTLSEAAQVLDPRSG